MGCATWPFWPPHRRWPRDLLAAVLLPYESCLLRTLGCKLSMPSQGAPRLKQC